MSEGGMRFQTGLRKRAHFLTLVPEVAAFVLLFLICLMHYNDETKPERVSIALSCYGVFLLTLIDLSILRSGIREKFSNQYRGLVFCCALYLFCDGLFWHVHGIREQRPLIILAGMGYELLQPVMTVLFWQLLRSWIREYTARERKLDRIMQGLSVLYALMIVADTLTGWMFTVDPETGLYHRGPGHWISVIYPSVMVVLVLIRILRNRESIRTKMVLMIHPLVPFICLLIQRMAGDWGPSLLPLAMCSAVIFHYTNVYVRVQQVTAQREQALAESKLRSLQAQINPHFIYNALSSVASLCDSDPTAAQEMVYQLSDYLHDNFSDLSKPNLTTFEEELNHLKHYISIEEKRFPNIRMEYDLKVTNFQLPRMTLQPLVENAVKHGICKRRKSAGTIRLTSETVGDAYEIRIEDNGVGFDTLPEGPDHIGIANVRTRLELLCQGTLTVTGKKDEGCIVKIRIPADQNRTEEA